MTRFGDRSQEYNGGMSSHFLSSGINILIHPCHLPPAHPRLSGSSHLNCHASCLCSGLLNFIVQHPPKIFTIWCSTAVSGVDQLYFSISILSLPCTSEESEYVHSILMKCFSLFNFSFVTLHPSSYFLTASFPLVYHSFLSPNST